MTLHPAYSIFAPKKPVGGILKIRIKFTDTKNTYEVVLIEKDTAISMVDSSGSSFLAIPGMIIVDEASMSKIKSILDELIGNGFFDKLLPI